MAYQPEVSAAMLGYQFDDLTVGMEARFGKTITDADIVMFAGISGDTNPVHLNQDFAEPTMFKGRIAHGMLSASLISTVLGTKLPGPGSIYVSQNLGFRAPVRIGDTVTAVARVAELLPKRRVRLETFCLVGDKVVIDGEAVMMVPAGSGRSDSQAG
ncbi:MaoC family dehydratase [Marinibaculum pumilum]|uniref:MaoC family dehydratase n=1 Tax=Marinibaculum pumilum TaxID=1766165 RepID=A0ABV7L3K0_9PROT